LSAPASPAPSPFWDTKPIADIIREAGTRLLRIPLRRSKRAYFRATPLLYLLKPPSGTAEPLYYAGSADGRRWTPIGGPRGLYLSEDPATTAAELRTLVLDTTGSVQLVVADQHIVTLAIEAVFERVLDVTRAEVLSALQLTPSDLHADWAAEQHAALTLGVRPPITQLLARAAHATGVVTAIRFPSARIPFGVNVVAFPDRLDHTRGEYIRTTDKHDLFPQTIPPATASPFVV
jgi:hypothetical protein